MRRPVDSSSVHGARGGAGNLGQPIGSDTVDEIAETLPDLPVATEAFRERPDHLRHITLRKPPIQAVADGCCPLPDTATHQHRVVWMILPVVSLQGQTRQA